VPLDSGWIQLGVYMFAGMLAGGLTNTLAVWMLFNPKERRFGFQGAVPKNQARLAKSIGRTVGERLLTPADLQRELARPELQAAFEQRLTELVRSILESDEPVINKVPPIAITAMESAMESYLPVAMEKLGGFLSRPSTRERMRTTLRTVFGRFLNDLRFHERVIAKLVVTESKMERALDTMQTEGVEQLVILLDDPVIREEITRTIHDAVLDYLRKPLAEVLSKVADIHEPGTPERVSAAMSPLIWAWIHDQVPELIQRLDLQGVVERKVMAFSTDRVEEILRGVLQNELRLIISIGYVLGAFVGLVTFGVSRLAGL
jgi:uncharacterized membrane protein YheB (UPF0754 family)